MRALEITPAEYLALLDQDDWSEGSRTMLERELSKAEKRAAVLSRMREGAKEAAIVSRFQAESVTKLRALQGLQFELTAWRRAGIKSECFYSGCTKAYTQLRGIRQRLARARRESLTDPAQAEWLANHSDLIAAVEGAGTCGEP